MDDRPRRMETTELIGLVVGLIGVALIAGTAATAVTGLADPALAIACIALEVTCMLIAGKDLLGK